MRPLRRLRRAITPVGRAVGLLGLTAGAAAAFTGTLELAVIAAVAAASLVVALPFVFLPQRVRGWVSVRPGHTHAGSSVRGHLVAENRSWLPVWQPLVAVPRGDEDEPVQVRLGVIRRGRKGTADFKIPTHQRGVVAVGPAATLRSDPFGFFRRSVTWGDATEVFVRPRTVPVPTLGAGYVRDLEGTPSDQLSMSDLSFHALREYVRGDDLRHVHWRSSARAGQLLVRQYHDTRRTHVTFVLDDTMSAYAREIEFELGVAVVASLMVTAATEGYDLTFLCGPHREVGRPVSQVLDATCRVQPSSHGSIESSVLGAAIVAPTMSLLILVTGSRSRDEEIAASLTALPDDARALVIRSDRDGEPEHGRIRGHPSLRVPRLRHLPGLMEGTLR